MKTFSDITKEMKGKSCRFKAPMEIRQGPTRECVEAEIFFEIGDPEQEGEGEFIQQGIWKKEDCGTLYASYADVTCVLAIMNPSIGTQDIAKGFVTNNGIFVIDISKGLYLKPKE